MQLNELLLKCIEDGVYNINKIKLLGAGDKNKIVNGLVKLKLPIVYDLIMNERLLEIQVRGYKIERITRNGLKILSID
jgi:hypothetical protein